MKWCKPTAYEECDCTSGNCDIMRQKKLYAISTVESRVMDGMHRVCKALIEDRGMISAVQFNDPLPPDYIGEMPDELLY